MSLKTNSNKEFLFNLMLIANFISHKRIKNDSIKKIFSQKLKNLPGMLKIKKNDLEHYYNYLQEQNIIFENNKYLSINLNLLKKLIKNEKEKNIKNIILQSNFDLLVKPEISIQAFFLIIQFAEILNKDVVYRFVITENSLHNAFINKISAKKIELFLLKYSTLKVLPQNVKYLIDDVYNRSGEITIGHSSGYITAEKHILQSLLQDGTIGKSIIKSISPTAGLLKNDTNLSGLFYYLKSKKFFPLMDNEKVVKTKDDFQISLNPEETEYFLAIIRTLKEVSFEHNIKTNFNLLNNISERIENALDKKAGIKAEKISTEYKNELKSSIKSYVLKSLKASLAIPQNLVLDKISASYKGDNPATTKKEIIKMVEFTLKHKVKLLVAYFSFSKRIEQIVVPKYLYDKKVFYYYNKETKEEESIVLTKIVFTALL